MALTLADIGTVAAAAVGGRRPRSRPTRSGRIIARDRESAAARAARRRGSPRDVRSLAYLLSPPWP